MRTLIPKHLIATSVSWASKLLTSLMQIILIPLFFKFLGVSDFALYNFLIGISSWFVLTDLSTSLVIQNRLSRYQIDQINDYQILGYYFYLNCLFILIFGLLLAVLGPIIFKFFVIKITNIGFREFIYIWVIFDFVFLANIIFLNTYKIYYALGKGFKFNSLNLLASLIGYLSLFNVLYFKLSKSLILLLLLGVIPNLLVNIICYYIEIESTFKFQWCQFIDFAKQVIYEARYFLLFALNGALVLQLDYFIIAYFLTDKDIIEYNWYTKVFGSAFAFYSILLNNYYSDCTKLLYAGKVKQALRGLWLQLILGLVIILCCALVLLIGKPLLSMYFFNHEITLSVTVLAAFGGYFLLRVWTDTWSLPLYATNQAKPMVKYILIQVILSVALQVILVHYYGLVGILLGLSCSFTLTVFWLFPFKVYKISHL